MYIKGIIIKDCNVIKRKSKYKIELVEQNMNSNGSFIYHNPIKQQRKQTRNDYLFNQMQNALIYQKLIDLNALNSN